jgi:hypothetical protein
MWNRHGAYTLLMWVGGWAGYYRGSRLFKTSAALQETNSSTTTSTSASNPDNKPLPKGQSRKGGRSKTENTQPHTEDRAQLEHTSGSECSGNDRTARDGSEQVRNKRRLLPVDQTLQCKRPCTREYYETGSDKQATRRTSDGNRNRGMHTMASALRQSWRGVEWLAVAEQTMLVGSASEKWLQRQSQGIEDNLETLEYA